MKVAIDLDHFTLRKRLESVFIVENGLKLTPVSQEVLHFHSDHIRRFSLRPNFFLYGHITLSALSENSSELTVTFRRWLKFTVIFVMFCTLVLIGACIRHHFLTQVLIWLGVYFLLGECRYAIKRERILTRTLSELPKISPMRPEDNERVYYFIYHLGLLFFGFLLFTF